MKTSRNELRWLIWLIIGTLVVMAPSGCTTSPERIAYKTVSAANIAVDTAMKTYGAEVVRKEKANDAGRAADPGGYVQRQREALLRHGKVVDALTVYQAAAKSAINVWLLAKTNGANAPPNAPVTAELISALNQLLALVKK